MKKILLFFSELNNGDLDWFVQKGKKELIPPDRLLIKEGNVSDALYIVVSGSFSVAIESQNQTELAIISEGEIVGEVSFIDTRPPLASVRSREESVVLSLPRVQLLSKLQQDTNFASRFYRAICLCLSDRLRGTGYDLDELEAHIGGFGQAMLGNLELAEAKFNWLIKNVRSS